MFVPLHIVSGYTFLSSGLTIEKIQTSVKSNDYFGAAITDKGVLYGVPSFIKSMEDINKKFLVGLEVEIDNDFICLYCINEMGYRNLMKISSAIQKERFNYDYLKEHTNGLVAVIETNVGLFKEKFLEKPIDTSFTKYLLNYSKLFGDYFYLGLEVVSKEGHNYANKIREFAKQYTYDCIAFPRIRYQKKDDAIVLKIVDAIANDSKITDRKLSGQEYFWKYEDYKKVYTKSELENTVKIVELSTFNYHQKRGELIHYPVENSKEFLKNLCFESLNNKLINDEKHVDRLNYELETINKLGFADYFLIVWDYVKYAKTHDILVGPGRGSAAGSLVSYLLNITEVDPLKYDLQFERFLNPYRKTMPDIDVDFMDIKREDMVEYMRRIYGKERIANIVTFQTILAKQSLRDIGRIYNFPEHHLKLLSKTLINKDYSLRDSYKKIPAFRKLVDSDQYFLDIVTLASKIEGLPRQSGLHAAGIVLDNSTLEESIPVSYDFQGNCISQYEMGYLEEQGFLKMDFLALRNLTIIDYSVAIINKIHKDAKLDKFNIPYDEEDVYKLIASCQTMGIFQLESSGMKNSIRVLKPSCFEDIITLLAIFRPGSLGEIQKYALRKAGKQKFSYPSEDLESILKPTYGIIIYQEQINLIAMKMAGFTMGEADMFRRGVSKKDKEKILSQKDSFIKGAIKNGYKEDVANKTFDEILKFANYGFNKSHAVVYAIIACRLAWLKLHYPLEFYCAILAISSGTSDTKFNEYVSEIKQRGFDILPPDINESEKGFVISSSGLRYPLSSIHGVNDLLVQNIIKERQNGKFTNFHEFVARMLQYKISETQIKNLIYSGALDCLYPSRASMLASIISAITYAKLVNDDSGQLNIGIELMPPPKMIKMEDDNLANLENEYNAIGIMLSSNPIKYKKEELLALGVTPIVEATNQLFESIENKEEFSSTIKVAGLIRSIKTITTKKSKNMSFLKIFDETGELEITIFPELYQEHLHSFEKNNLVIFEGKLEYRNDAVSFIADKVLTLED